MKQPIPGIITFLGTLFFILLSTSNVTAEDYACPFSPTTPTQKQSALLSSSDHTSGGNLADIRMVPHFRCGKAIGLKLLSVKPGSLYQRVGLKRGDVILQINGHDADVETFTKKLETFSSRHTILLERTNNRILIIEVVPPGMRASYPHVTADQLDEAVIPTCSIADLSKSEIHETHYISQSMLQKLATFGDHSLLDVPTPIYVVPGKVAGTGIGLKILSITKLTADFAVYNMPFSEMGLKTGDLLLQINEQDAKTGGIIKNFSAIGVAGKGSIKILRNCRPILIQISKDPNS